MEESSWSLLGKFIVTIHSRSTLSYTPMSRFWDRVLLASQIVSCGLKPLALIRLHHVKCIFAVDLKNVVYFLQKVFIHIIAQNCLSAAFFVWNWSHEKVNIWIESIQRHFRLFIQRHFLDLRATALKSLAEHAPNVCEAFRDAWTLLHSRRDKQDEVSTTKLLAHIFYISTPFFFFT